VRPPPETFQKLRDALHTVPIVQRANGSAQTAPPPGDPPPQPLSADEVRRLEQCKAHAARQLAEYERRYGRK
jgi:hypothetical protein